MSNNIDDRHYYIDTDGDGDTFLWSADRPDDPQPEALAMCSDLDDPDEEWQLLVRGANLDPDTGVTADEDTVERVAHAITKAASDKCVMGDEELKLARAAINAIGGGDA